MLKLNLRNYNLQTCLTITNLPGHVNHSAVLFARVHVSMGDVGLLVNSY